MLVHVLRRMKEASIIMEASFHDLDLRDRENTNTGVFLGGPGNRYIILSQSK